MSQLITELQAELSALRLVLNAQRQAWMTEVYYPKKRELWTAYMDGLEREAKLIALIQVELSARSALFG